jgi:hypothetical protein
MAEGQAPRVQGLVVVADQRLENVLAHWPAGEDGDEDAGEAAGDG